MVRAPAPPTVVPDRSPTVDPMPRAVSVPPTGPSGAPAPGTAGPGPGRAAPAGRSTAPGPALMVRRLVWPLIVALVAAAGTWVTWRVFVRTEHGQAVDEAALDGAHIGQNRLWEIAEPVLSVVSVGFIAAAILTCAVIAFLRRRWSLALVAAAVLIGANATTRVLKVWVLDRPDHGYGPDLNTLPSGHTTAAASVAAAVLLVVPPLARPWVAVLGAGYAGATGVSTLIGQWHRPSDVVAALFVVLAWAALGCAVLAPADPTVDRSPPTAVLRSVPGGGGERAATRIALGLLAVVTVLAGLGAVLTLRRTWLAADPDGSRAALLTSYGGGALGIVAASAAVFGVLLVLRRSVTSGSVRVGPTS